MTTSTDLARLLNRDRLSLFLLTLNRAVRRLHKRDFASPRYKAEITTLHQWLAAELKRIEKENPCQPPSQNPPPTSSTRSRKRS